MTADGAVDVRSLSGLIDYSPYVSRSLGVIREKHRGAEGFFPAKASVKSLTGLH